MAGDRLKQMLAGADEQPQPVPGQLGDELAGYGTLLLGFVEGVQQDHGVVSGGLAFQRVQQVLGGVRVPAEPGGDLGGELVGVEPAAVHRDDRGAGPQHRGGADDRPVAGGGQQALAVRRVGDQGGQCEQGRFARAGAAGTTATAPRPGSLIQPVISRTAAVRPSPPVM